MKSTILEDSNESVLSNAKAFIDVVLDAWDKSKLDYLENDALNIEYAPG